MKGSYNSHIRCVHTVASSTLGLICQTQKSVTAHRLIIITVGLKWSLSAGVRHLGASIIKNNTTSSSVTEWEVCFIIRGHSLFFCHGSQGTHPFTTERGRTEQWSWKLAHLYDLLFYFLLRELLFANPHPPQPFLFILPSWEPPSPCTQPLTGCPGTPLPCIIWRLSIPWIQITDVSVCPAIYFRNCWEG